MPKTGFFVYVGGINGSGKSTVVEATKNKFPEDVTVFHASKLLLDSLRLSYRELDNIPNIQQKQIRNSFYNDKKIFNLKTTIGLIDAHYVIPKNGKLEICVEELWVENIAMFVHVVTEPDLIYQRLLQDAGSLNRRLMKYDIGLNNITGTIRSIQNFSISVAEEISARLRKPFSIVDNNSDVDTAAMSMHEQTFKTLLRQ